LRIYGDGSAGQRIVESSTSLRDINLQYMDFIVEEGVTLTVPSGTVIRCAGQFINRGVVRVETGALGGFRSTIAPDEVEVPPHPGISNLSATHGELGGRDRSLAGGLGGVELSEFEARQILLSGVNAGGGGGAAASDRLRLGLGKHNSGQAGGGSLVILARDGVINDGEISADGQSPTVFGVAGGGGAGGVVILASAGSISNFGVIHADGGAGQSSDTNEGPSGGGGGGIVHLISPIIDNSGQVRVAGGVAGTAGLPASVTESVRSGGAGGGACGGTGGDGGGVHRNLLFPTRGDPEPATDGEPGYVFETPVDPTALF
jgi:hypothetical protein